jgi:hypothetical protein
MLCYARHGYRHALVQLYKFADGAIILTVATLSVCYAIVCVVCNAVSAGR